MNRMINDPNLVVEEAIQGYLRAYPEYYRRTEHPRVLAHPSVPIAGKVGVVSGGGSGHEPAFLGYVGKSLLDAVAIGEIFSSPTSGAFLDAFRAAHGGEGVVCLYGNYAGDNMNVALAIKKAAVEGIVVKTVVANDDVASAPESEREKRRGVAGEIFMWKVGAASAARGDEMDRVIAYAQRAIDRCRSIGIGLSACTLPALGKPNFSIADGSMEVGIGHHGEPGIRVEPLRPAAEMAETMLHAVMAELALVPGSEVAVLVSGLGATPVMELYIYYDAVARRLEAQGIAIHRCYVGNYFTSLDMMGVTLTVMALDDELKLLLNMPVSSPGLTQEG
ncbi:dihydroxyacetone kinase subunit DhaK [Edwardsiella ictaluri]|uniref:dihydroxyacetone kinase subunit DhaK n=1 Tax=Edwardsiella ictaluri TaxID=67780 RepID=UPI0018DC409B|nr:dihydroxyacetone kinase subunit DhaK [Edwardsiella ictaluri]QPW29587.1 dihydroxyacetone kinase subunit DhaK [Edwardsiella ictaluri]UYB62711.1 dihydroxyacetone kinase subunit DhaK [Edwardsiella ictaluri]UYB65937.1 dihydroxyacetone kinase subunit DhaK [Edwardsiella ictaluri]WJH20626.1 dihydroxyacetone kinase subunit DhaK [Edwardsiella ictaluri]BEI12278.1 dihydroxyacetone kinase subunit DhaK [Edwardsiella ictaluri]